MHVATDGDSPKTARSCGVPKRAMAQHLGSRQQGHCLRVAEVIVVDECSDKGRISVAAPKELRAHRQEVRTLIGRLTWSLNG